MRTEVGEGEGGGRGEEGRGKEQDGGTAPEERFGGSDGKVL